VCAGLVDGSFVSLGKCKREYAECVNEVALPRLCEDVKRVYDNVTKSCIPRHDEPYCRALPPPPSPTPPNGELAQHCVNLDDGFYRHPLHCTKFVQCYERVAYVFTCSSGLVFNAKEDVIACDYPRNVPECVDAEIGTGIDRECEGVEDGEFLRNPADCHKYRRCVDGRLVEQDCPEGLVFNKQLDVCDYEHNVPECCDSELCTS